MTADPNYQTRNYEKQGGDTWVVGGTLDIASGGVLSFGGVAASGNFRGGQHSATAGEASGNIMTIATGLTAITAQLVQILRTGADVTADAVVTVSAGTISVADGGVTYNVTSGDVVNWIAIGS